MSDICKILAKRGWNYYFEARVEGGATGFWAEASRGNTRIEARGDTLRHALSKLLLTAISENGIAK